jgi:hypothetical protein
MTAAEKHALPGDNAISASIKYFVAGVARYCRHI